MFRNTTDFCMKILFAMLHSNGQLTTERDGDTEKGCQKPSAEDYWWWFLYWHETAVLWLHLAELQYILVFTCVLHLAVFLRKLVRYATNSDQAKAASVRLWLLLLLSLLLLLLSLSLFWQCVPSSVSPTAGCAERGNVTSNATTTTCSTTSSNAS